MMSYRGYCDIYGAYCRKKDKIMWDKLTYKQRQTRMNVQYITEQIQELVLKLIQSKNVYLISYTMKSYVNTEASKRNSIYKITLVIIILVWK
jgi:hypothetical protein